MEITRFASDDVESILVSHPERIEGLPFGAILIDRDGIVLRYNNAQGLIWDRNSIDMLGKNFFEEVAPAAATRPCNSPSTNSWPRAISMSCMTTRSCMAGAW